MFWLKEPTNEAILDDYLTNSIKGLNDNIHMHDGFFWCKYGLLGDYANWKFHSLHILQFNKIAQVYSQDSSVIIDNIVEYSTKFKQYRYIPLGFSERLLFQSNNMLLVVLLTNLFFNFFIFVSMSIVKIRKKVL